MALARLLLLFCLGGGVAQVSPRWKQLHPRVANRTSWATNGGIPARNNHVMINCNNTIFVFGGWGNRVEDAAGEQIDGGSNLNDTWIFDPEENTWTEVEVLGPSPSPRNGAGAVCFNGDVVVHGGWASMPTGEGLTNEVWRFSSENHTWTLLYPKHGLNSSDVVFIYHRVGHTFSLYKDSAIATGGWGGGGEAQLFDHGWVLDDVLLFNFSTGNWTEIVARGDGAMGELLGHVAFIMGDELFILKALESLGVFSKLNLVTHVWTSISRTNGELGSLKGRSEARIAIVGVLAFMFGGEVFRNSLTRDVWVYHHSNQVWSRMVPATLGPAGRKNPGMVRVDGGLLVFGGESARQENDTWFYSLEGVVPSLAENVSIAPDGWLCLPTLYNARDGGCHCRCGVFDPDCTNPTRTTGCDEGVACDHCAVCGGNNISCSGCDGVLHSGKTLDACDVCGGNVIDALVCDIVPHSEKRSDAALIVVASCTGCFVVALLVAALIYRNARKMVVNKFEVDYDTLIFGDVIGQGGFGVVYEGEWRGCRVAIKKLRALSLQRVLINEFASEINIMCELRHPNVVLFMGACTKPPNLCMVTELMGFGSVYSILHHPDVHLKWESRISILTDCVHGMKFLHKADPPIIHRDLKSQNLLVSDSWVTKVADFGLGGVKETLEGDGKVGSLLWAAPEVLCGAAFTQMADVFSFGVTAWEVLTNDILYDDKNAFCVSVLVSKGLLTPKFRDDTPTDLKAILESCLAFDPDDRPSFSTVATVLAAAAPGSMLSTSGEWRNRSHKGQGIVHTGSVSAPLGEVVFIAVTVEGLRNLWVKLPMVMSVALLQASTLLRETAVKYKGYDASSEGGNHLFVFSSAQAACSFACDAQIALFELPWPPELVVHPLCKEVWSGDALVLRGLRVKMAVDRGTPIIQRDPMSQRVSYYGPCIERCCSLLALINGGQVVVTDAAIDQANATGGLDPLILANSLGPSDLSFLSDELRRPILFDIRYKLFDGRPMMLCRAKAGPLAVDFTELVGDTNPFNNIDYKDLNFGTKLGEGTFGETFKGTLHGSVIAIKRLVCTRLPAALDANFTAEVICMSQLDHPNIVKLIGATNSPARCMIFEYAAKGSLLDRLRDPKETWTPSKELQTMADIIAGMEHLHALQPPMLHRDLKSANILVHANWRVVISDFGLARLRSTVSTMTVCGTVAWIAPEVLRGERYTETADVYSFGIVCYEILSRQLPYEGLGQLQVVKKVSTEQYRPTLPSSTPELAAMVQSCWDETASERPSFATLHTTLPSIASALSVELNFAKSVTSRAQIIATPGVAIAIDREIAGEEDTKVSSCSCPHCAYHVTQAQGAATSTDPPYNAPTLACHSSVLSDSEADEDEEYTAKNFLPPIYVAP